MQTELKPGGNIDSWCGKCKLVLAHTIEAMIGNKPARVHCNTCKSQHSYKANAPSTSPRQTRKREGGTTPRQPKTRASRFESLMKDKNSSAARPYSPKETYEEGDILDHHTFGRGVATAVKDGSKIEVLFESGSKTLVHGK